MKKKTYQLGVRMDEDLLARLRRFEEQTGISSSALARATLESALDYFESEKEIVFPLCCVPRKSVIPPPHFVIFFAFPREIFYAPRERFFSPHGKSIKNASGGKSQRFSTGRDVLSPGAEKIIVAEPQNVNG